MTMAGFLTEMATVGSRSRHRGEERGFRKPTSGRAPRSLPLPPQLKLSATGFDVIAELKLNSPAQGRLGAL